jgi:hypothetical protein
MSCGMRAGACFLGSALCFLGEKLQVPGGFQQMVTGVLDPDLLGERACASSAKRRYSAALSCEGMNIANAPRMERLRLRTSRS